MKRSECVKVPGSPYGIKIPFRAILFWGTHDMGDYYIEVAPERDPGDYIDESVPQEWREAVAKYLDSGKQILGYMGYADCRICGDTLGTRDMGLDGYVWPEAASHYVLAHKVWTPEHEEIYRRVTK